MTARGVWGGARAHTHSEGMREFYRGDPQRERRARAASAVASERLDVQASAVASKGRVGTTDEINESSRGELQRRRMHDQHDPS